MEEHPSYKILKPLLESFPENGASLWQAYNDLVHSQKWVLVEPIELKEMSRAVLIGIRAKNEFPRIVVPIALSETLSSSWFSKTFRSLSRIPKFPESISAISPPLPEPQVNQPLELPETIVATELRPQEAGEDEGLWKQLPSPPVIYTAIVGNDSSVVYYRLAKGIEKPHDVPE